MCTGLFVHWGIYSKLDLPYRVSDVCSWPLCWATRGSSNPVIRTKQEMTQFREKYWELSRSFKPTKFDPDLWAELAYNAGMKYVVFTTKHHDGFNMYNTTLDEYSVVGKDCPWKRDPFADVVTAFRKKNMGIGAYFSKSDWHRKDFWNESRFAESYAPNYEPADDPDQWASFSSYARNQLIEITTNYKPDILWLDAGFMVSPAFDIGMAKVVKTVKSIKSGIIVVDRGGRVYEEIVTPEQSGIPQGPLQQPWELCQSMGDQWGFIRSDVYKTAKELIITLVTTASRGGNYLLDIGPDPDGQFPDAAVNRLKELASWMKVNGEGIHDTEPLHPYYVISTYRTTCIDCIHYALTRKGRTVYVFLTSDSLPSKVLMAFVTESNVGGNFRFRTYSVKLLGSDSKLTPDFSKGYLSIDIPANTKPPCKYVFGFKLEEEPERDL